MESKNELKEIHNMVADICNRLTIQEEKFKNHIDTEKDERQKNDEHIDRKYAFLSTLTGIGTFFVAVLEIKNKYF